MGYSASVHEDSVAKLDDTMLSTITAPIPPVLLSKTIAVKLSSNVTRLSTTPALPPDGATRMPPLEAPPPLRDGGVAHHQLRPQPRRLKLDRIRGAVADDAVLDEQGRRIAKVAFWTVRCSASASSCRCVARGRQIIS
jgi:hypothetical protein